MEAKLKSGKIIKGALAKTFVRRGLAKKITPKKVKQPVKEDVEIKQNKQSK